MKTHRCRAGHPRHDVYGGGEPRGRGSESVGEPSVPDGAVSASPFGSRFGGCRRLGVSLLAAR